MNLRDVKYFQDNRISNSDLGLLKKSPWLFRQTKDKKVDKVDTSFFEMGTLIHLAILEPDQFVVAEIDKPGGMMGKFLDSYVECGMNEEAAKFAHDKSGFKLPLKTILNKFQGEENKKEKEYKDINKYLEFIRVNNDKLLLTKSQKYTIDHAEWGINRNPIAKQMLWGDSGKDVDVFTEQELYGILDGVGIKGKIDRLEIDHKNKVIRLIDLKSTSSQPYFRLKQVHNSGDLLIDYQSTNPEFFGSFKNWGYYRQVAFYKTLIAENFKQYFDKYKFECYIVAVNTTDSFDCSVIEISDKWLLYGRVELEEYLFRYKEHLKTGNWNYPLLDSTKGLIKI